MRTSIYWLTTNKALVQRTTLISILLIGMGVLGVWIIKRQAPSAVVERYATLSPGPSPSSSPFADYQLVINKISVNVPVVIDVPSTEKDEKTYLKALYKGVAHYKGTVHPGEKGNSFIYGHSSYFKDQPYKEIFKHLNEIKVDDIFTIEHQGQTLTYKVFKSKIVPEDDVSVLEKIGDKETVTIMTCWPPGTIVKRYVVQAERIFPDTPTHAAMDR